MKMEQPSLPNTIPQASSSKETTNNGTATMTTTGKGKKMMKMKVPTPQELISHYQSQGMDSQEASIKVIEDLQKVLFRVISANSKNKKDKFMAETSKKMDVVNNRLALVDMKVDSKPGYAGAFAVGLASGAALKGIESAWPHILGGFAQIWSAVSRATKPPSPSSSSP